MKKISAFILIFIIFSLGSCSNNTSSSLEIVEKFKNEYGIDGRVYSTLLQEGEDGYIDANMENALFLNEEINMEYSVFMRASLDSVSELCVFKTQSESEMLDAENIANQRLELLSEFVKEGESFIYKKGRLLAYGFFKDAKSAKGVLEGIA